MDTNDTIQQNAAPEPAPALPPSWPVWAKTVLVHLAKGCSTTEAAKRAEVSRQAVYDLKGRDTKFASFYAAALRCAKRAADSPLAAEPDTAECPQQYDRPAELSEDELLLLGAPSESENVRKCPTPFEAAANHRARHQQGVATLQRFADLERLAAAYQEYACGFATLVARLRAEDGPAAELGLAWGHAGEVSADVSFLGRPLRLSLDVSAEDTGEASATLLLHAVDCKGRPGRLCASHLLNREGQLLLPGSGTLPDPATPEGLQAIALALLGTVAERGER